MIRDEPAPARLVPRPPALMFGVPITDVTLDETMVLIGELVREGREFGRTHQISTVNVDFLVNALEHDDVAQILQHADVCLPDGMPIVWASRLLEMPLRERVAGADLVPLLIEASASAGWHVHVFGSMPDVADEARGILARRYPGAHFSIDAGPMIPDVREVDDAVLDSITDIDPDILCVALGNPKQERFIAEHAARLGVPVMIGVGGSLDMLVGRRRRAPAWIGRIGLEWVVRAAQEPTRLGKRYANDIRVFLPAFGTQWRAHRARRRGSGLRIQVDDGAVTVTLGGDDIAPSTLWATAAQSVLDGTPIVVDASSVTSLSDPALAQTVGLVQAARRSDADVRWASLHSALRDWCRSCGLTPEMLGFPVE